jgi:glucokinase
VADGPDAVADDMSGAILKLLSKHGRGGDFAGLGVGTPGPLSLPDGILPNPPNLPGFNGYNLGLPPRLRQTVKTLFAVGCKSLDRQDHCSAF